MTPRTPEASRETRERTSQAILAAAAKVFAKRGYSGTKVADIAAEAGVSSGLVHHYFETKADVFATLVGQVMGAATQVPSEALEREGTPAENLRWMLEQMLLGAAHAPEYYLLALQAQMSEAVPEATRQLVDERGAEGLALMTQLVERAQAAGVARAGDPAALMTHALATVQGLAIQIAFAPAPIPGVPDVDVILGMLGVGAKAKGGRS